MLVPMEPHTVELLLKRRTPTLIAPLIAAILSIACAPGPNVPASVQKLLQKANTLESRLAFGEAKTVRSNAKKRLSVYLEASHATLSPDAMRSAQALLHQIENILLPRSELGIAATSSLPAAALWTVIQQPERQRKILLSRLVRILSAADEHWREEAMRWMAPNMTAGAWLEQAEKSQSPKASDYWDAALSSLKNQQDYAQRGNDVRRLITVAPRAGRLKQVYEWLKQVPTASNHLLIHLARTLAENDMPDLARLTLERLLQLAREADDINTRAAIAAIYSAHGAEEAAAFIFDEIGLRLTDPLAIKQLAKALSRAGDVHRLMQLANGIADHQLIGHLITDLARLAPMACNLKLAIPQAAKLGASGGTAQAAIAVAVLQRELPCLFQPKNSSDCDESALLPKYLNLVKTRRGRAAVFLKIARYRPKYFQFAAQEAQALFTPREQMEALMHVALSEARAGYVESAMTRLDTVIQIASRRASAQEHAERLAHLFVLAHEEGQQSVATQFRAQALLKARSAKDPLRGAQLITRLSLQYDPVVYDSASTVFSVFPKLREGTRSSLLRRWSIAAQDNPQLANEWIRLAEMVQQPERAMSLRLIKVQLITRHQGLLAGLQAAGQEQGLKVEAIRHSRADEVGLAVSTIMTLSDSYDRAQCIVQLLAHSPMIPPTKLKALLSI